MKEAHRILLVVPAVLLFAGIGAITYYAKFLRHEASLEQELATYSDAIDGFKEALDEQSTTEQKLRELAQSTLGFSPEQVDSNFRAGLNSLAIDAGLVKEGIVVTTQAAKPVKNPAVEQRVTEFSRVARLDFVALSDLYMVDADLRGTGSFAAVTRLIALAQSQPWIWSVRGFSLKPLDPLATTFDIRLDVSTAFMPDLAPPPSAEADQPAPASQPPPIVDPTADQVLASGTVVSRNVFAPPPPPATEPVTLAEAGAPGAAPGADPTAAPPPPPPPYHEWRLRGLWSSPGQGDTALMLNDRTGGTLYLTPGQGVLDAVLVLASTDGAVFQIGENRFQLALNDTLADRRPVD